jgi:hypothetical protein
MYMKNATPTSRMYTTCVCVYVCMYACMKYATPTSSMYTTCACVCMHVCMKYATPSSRMHTTCVCVCMHVCMYVYEVCHADKQDAHHLSLCVCVFAYTYCMHNNIKYVTAHINVTNNNIHICNIKYVTAYINVTNNNIHTRKCSDRHAHISLKLSYEEVRSKYLHTHTYIPRYIHTYNSSLTCPHHCS